MKSLYFIVTLLMMAACSSNSKKQKTAINLPKADTISFQQAVANPYAPIDISPMDMSYLPDDYPIMKMEGKVHASPVARVIYSRPHKQGRRIFGTLLKYGEPWRLGANEATEIDFFEPVTIMDKKVDKGRYVIYCIPHENSWTIILNSNLDTWGLKPDSKKDLYKFIVPVNIKDQSIEYYSMVFKNTSYGADLVMAWDDIETRLPLYFKKAQ